jgi:ADP-L-glycero-D-manno-heptose 6-epimerase
MILITGAAGFIGSYMVGKFNKYKVRDLLLCDDFSKSYKKANLINKEFIELIEREELFDRLPIYSGKIEAVIHLGARTDTTSQDIAAFEHLNTGYSRRLWEYCTQEQVAFIYASSAATYGDGSLGFSDSISPEYLHPLNPYAVSKNEFDRFASVQTMTPPFWCGLKFFNVYGPNEYHKGRMASVIFHAFRQISDSGSLRLFRSHNTSFPDGGQMRDFIHVDDVCEYIWFIYKRQSYKGLLNMGTGKARSFNDLANAVFCAMDKVVRIEWIDTPEDIRNSYQYFTEADTRRLNSINYPRPVKSLEEGILSYVKNYLLEGKYF